MAVNGSFPPKSEYVRYGRALLVCAGQTKDNVYLSQTWEINLDVPPLKADEKGNVNTARTGHALANTGPEVFCLGGFGDDGFLSSVEIYADGKWRAGPDMAEEAKDLATVFMESSKRLYVFGGKKKGGYTQGINSLEVRIPGSKWEYIKELDVPAVHANQMYMAAVVDEQVLLFGSFEHGETMLCDPLTGDARPCEGAKFPDVNRLKSNAVYVVGSEVYAFGYTDDAMYHYKDGRWRCLQAQEWAGQAISVENPVSTYSH